MTPKQEKFCVEYLVDLNGTQAALRAGYSERTARSIANQLLTKLDIQNRINEIRKTEFQKRIMTIEEIEARLADAARGDLEEEVVIVEQTGDFCSRARVVTKQIAAKDQIKALELLGKRNQLFVDRLQMSAEVVPVIVDDIPDDDE